MTPPLTSSDRRMTVFAQALAIVGVLLALLFGWLVYIIVNAPVGAGECQRAFEANGNRLPLKYVPFTLFGGWKGSVAASCEVWAE